jgi:estrone sulfotransferase
MSSALHQLRHYVSKTKARVPVIWARHRGLNAADVFLGSYPRSGNTWLRFLLLEILTGKSAEFRRTNDLLPDVGAHKGVLPLLPNSGRLLKTHESYRPEYKKAIYLVRDARDVVSSEYAFQTSRGWFDGSLDEYVQLFVRGQVSGYGSWQSHVSSWIDSPLASDGNLLLLRFEDMRRDTAAALSKIGGFLGVDVKPSDIARAIESNSLDNMREKEKKNPQRVSQKGRFVGSGSVEGWRSKLSDAQIKTIEKYAAGTLLRVGYPCGESSNIAGSTEPSPSKVEFANFQ